METLDIYNKEHNVRTGFYYDLELGFLDISQYLCTTPDNLRLISLDASGTKALRDFLNEVLLK